MRRPEVAKLGARSFLPNATLEMRPGLHHRRRRRVYGICTAAVAKIIFQDVYRAGCRPSYKYNSDVFKWITFNSKNTAERF